MVFVDTDSLPGTEERAGRLIQNRVEADLIKQVLSSSYVEATCLTTGRQTVALLIASGVPAHDIGVIAMYRQQIKLLATELEAFKDVEVLTADRSQGRDKECVLMSFTRSNEEGKVGRAKQLFWVFC